MSDNISYSWLTDHDYNVTLNISFWPCKDVMPYLIRRAEENSSVAGQNSH
jgi:proline dehydrogenase